MSQTKAELLEPKADFTISGTTPTLTIGDAGAEDTKIVFDGNAQDFYIGLDDSADDLLIGLGSTVGTTPIISVDENKDVNIPDGTLTISNTGNEKTLNLISTDADASHGPYIRMFRNSSSAADEDLVGRIDFANTNDADEEENYLMLYSRIEDASNGNESGKFYLDTMVNGTITNRIYMKKDLTVFNEDSADIDFRVESKDYAECFLIDAGGNQVTMNKNITGTAVVNEDGALRVMNDTADQFAGCFRHEGNATSRLGLKIQCGTDDNSGTNYSIVFRDGNNDSQGYVTFSGGTVTYGAFTAHHPCIIPNADNDSSSTEPAYPYGTLLETTSLSYTQKNGSDTERGIIYNVQKTESAYSRKVLGAYGSCMNGGPDGQTNEHQALVLGDGHILCNNEKGNISIGDGICSSSTAGIGMKADKMAMIIGIAQEDVTFSGSETKLVAVQYGVRQFTPWTD